MALKLWNDQRLRLTLTRLGMEYLAVLSLMGFFALNSGNNLLYLVFSLMMGLFLVSGWVSRRAIQGLELQNIEEGNLFARVRGGIRIRFKDHHPQRIRGLEVSLELEGARGEPGFYAGGQRRDPAALVVLPARPDLRGWHPVHHLEMRTRFPFGFLEKAWRFPVEKSVLVLPHPRATLLRRDPEGDVKAFLPAQGFSSPEGARPFRTGDPLSQVHWKRTAQRGIPWVRTFEGEETAGLRLRLDVRSWLPGAAFEKELECLSGAILQARLQKLDVFLDIQTFDGKTEHSGPTECWRALALAKAQGTALATGETDSPAFPSPRKAIP